MHNLLTTIRQNTRISVIGKGKGKNLGYNLNWNYTGNYVELSLPTYVNNISTKLNYISTKFPQHLPHCHIPIKPPKKEEWQTVLAIPSSPLLPLKKANGFNYL